MGHAVESISVRPQDRPYRRISEAPAILAELWFDERSIASHSISYSFIPIRGDQQAAEQFSNFLKLYAYFASEAPIFSQPRSVRPELVEAYDEKLRDAESAIEAIKLERTLAEASNNRQGISALMEEEWLGLRLLTQLRLSRQMSVTDLATKLGAQFNSVAAIMARLVRFGVVDVVQEKFVCTELADELLSNIERKANVNLKEE